MSGNHFGDPVRRDQERHLLAAVDDEPNSRRAVMYLADFFSGQQGVFITLLSIIQEPSEDCFATDDERRQWLVERRRTMEKVLGQYRELLREAGFNDGQIATRLIVRPCTSVGDAILEEQAKLRCCIVVVGRRGIGHNEEFIFGSTSSKVLHQARNCAVLVVE